MRKELNTEIIARLLNRMVDGKNIFSAVMRVENSDKTISWSGAAGNMQTDSRYFIASVTKLYVTAVVLQMSEENRISLNDRISRYLPESWCEKLHVYKGVDYSDDLTVRHLISNTSGLPDYFFHRQDNGIKVADSLLAGKDEPWPIEKTIGLIKQLKPRFKPGAKGKAAYSDTNYQLLGRIIENVAGKPVGDVFQDYIFSKLNLKNTYAYVNNGDRSPVPFYFKSNPLWLPEYMESITPEGGIVSTAEEVMIFLKAFFSGSLFPKDRIEGLKKWNMIFPPPGLFLFGAGLEKLWIPWFATPLKPPGEILGFWGQTGTFAFYNPKTDLYFCGATNQIDGKGHRAATSAMLKIIQSVL